MIIAITQGTLADDRVDDSSLYSNSTNKLDSHTLTSVKTWLKIDFNSMTLPLVEHIACGWMLTNLT